MNIGINFLILLGVCHLVPHYGVLKSWGIGVASQLIFGFLIAANQLHNNKKP